MRVFLSNQEEIELNQSWSKIESSLEIAFQPLIIWKYDQNALKERTSYLLNQCDIQTSQLLTSKINNFVPTSIAQYTLLYSKQSVKLS